MCKRYSHSMIYDCKCVEGWNKSPRIIRNFSEAEIDLLLSPGKKIEYRRYHYWCSYKTEKVIHCNACLDSEKFLSRNMDKAYQRF